MRGTTSLKIVEMMREAGAAEVHFPPRSPSPPTAHSCFYGSGIRPNASKLLAARWISNRWREFIKADSLAFISIDGLYRAVGREGRDVCPVRNFCDACFTGDYPTSLTDLSAGRTKRPPNFPSLIPRLLEAP